jgi:threonine synthase
VEDQEMVDAMYELATTEGIIACPEGAATLVGLKKLLEQGFLGADETIVLLNTGSGYKYLDLISGPAGG